MRGLIKKYWRPGLLVVLLMVNVLVWSAVRREERRGILTVSFLDVGQGDAIYIEAPNGNQILLDGGPGKKVLAALARVMPFYDRSLDLVIASHPDADHIGGLVDVVERFAVSGFLEPGVFSDNQVYQVLKQTLAEKKTPVFLARRGMRIILHPAVYLEILFPDRDPAGWNTNDASIVAKLIYGQNSFLLTGDSPLKIENYLVNLDGGRLRSEVLKVGHHGSRTSSGKIFLAAVRPEYAVISAGKNNRYGHPHQEVLANFRGWDTKILRTAEQGTIVFRANGFDLTFVSR